MTIMNMAMVETLSCSLQTRNTKFLIAPRDGQNHHMLMILKSKSNHLNKGDLKSKSKSF